MDGESLPRLSALPRGLRCDRRVQRQIHVEPDGAARRRGGDSGGPYPKHLSELLPAFRALGVLGAAPRRGSVMPSGGNLAFHDWARGEERFRDAVLAGLGRTPKELPCKLFYDARGSALFEQICEVPEYYLTRTEIAILAEYAGAIARHIGANCRLIELGSGASRKVRILLAALAAPAADVPVGMSR